MMLTRFLPLAALPLAAYAIAEPNPAENSGILHFPVSASARAPLAKGNSKRQINVGVEKQSNGLYYSTDVTIGTQTVKLQLDTGSAELWVNPECSNAGDKELCQKGGQYQRTGSFESTGKTGGVTYKIGSTRFDYGYDSVTIGSAKIDKQMFGVATSSSEVSLGMLGIGPDTSGWDSPYPFVLDTLVSQNIIKSRAFSLDLRNIEDPRGSVIFGGIDTKKFSGTLEKLPIVPANQSPDGFTRYWVNLEGITVQPQNGQSSEVFSGKQAVLLDSGYSMSGLPSATYERLTAAFNANANLDQPQVDCSFVKTTGTLGFKFGGTVINVPFANFIIQIGDFCYLGAFRSDNFPVLGDTFLRAAYLVYDWDNRNIHIANNEDCGSNIVAIGSGTDSVPSLTGECQTSGSADKNINSPAPSTAVTVPPSSQAPPPTSTAITSSQPSSKPTSKPSWHHDGGFRNGPPNHYQYYTFTKTVYETQFMAKRSIPSANNEPSKSAEIGSLGYASTNTPNNSTAFTSAPSNLTITHTSQTTISHDTLPSSITTSVTKAGSNITISTVPATAPTTLSGKLQTAAPTASKSPDSGAVSWGLPNMVLLSLGIAISLI